MVGLSKKRVFPKTKGDSITGQDRAQKHCDFRFSQIENKSKVAVLQLVFAKNRPVSLNWSDYISSTHVISNNVALRRAYAASS